MTNRFHNISNEALADLIGEADLKAKAATAELEALKAEMKGRGLAGAIGQRWAVSVSEFLQARIDTAAVRALLGDKASQVEKVTISNRVTIKANPAMALAA
jgi:hypothetical protein